MPLPVQLVLLMAGAALALATDVPALPALHCPTDATADQCKEYSSNRFSVEGFVVKFTYEVNKLLKLECINNLQLDEAEMIRWLPRFTPALHVGNVTVSDCQPVHYATVLAALNVTLTSHINLELYNVRQNEPLTAAHFADLPPLRHLTVRDAGVLHGLPASLEGLTMLTIQGTTLLDESILEALPRTLTKLRLEAVNITRVPTAVLDLPELRSLDVDFWVVFVKFDVVGVVERSNASQLQQLHVEVADAALMSEWAPSALEEVTLSIWQAVSPNQLHACDKLVKLKLYLPKVSDLPTGWVSRCPRLKELHIMRALNLKMLPARLLVNATQLTNFGIQFTRLSSLPAQLFADTPHLTHLDLSYNQFKELPSSMLTLPLLSLNLGGNKFNTSVVSELATFTELRSLSLEWSWELRDLCAVNSNVTEYKLKSSLASLSKLERLELQGTNISVICNDWLEDLVNLKYLDLSNTNIRNVTHDLQYQRSVPDWMEPSFWKLFSDKDRIAMAAMLAKPSRNVTVDCGKLTIFFN